MDSLYKELSSIENSGKPAALCIIIESHGSTPRKAGTKMIVYPNGSISGTIGGGQLEHLVIERAKEVMQTGQASIENLNLNDDAGMSCGGATKVYIEPIKPKYQLYIFGAGHIGRFLAKVAPDLGFQVTLIDERDGIFDNFPVSNIQFINKHHSQVFDSIHFVPSTFICVATHNHDYDREIIAHCAKKTYAYLGMIGSKNKIEKSKQLFREKQLLSEQEMRQIDWPMGVKINCETPEEIGISILAKLVDIKAPKKVK